MSKCAIRSISEEKKAIESRSKFFFSMSVISSIQKSASLVGNDRKQVDRRHHEDGLLPFMFPDSK